MWARLVAAGLEKDHGRRVIVENKPGGGGVIAANTLLNTPADGSSILVMAASTLIIPSKLVKPTPFELSDFAPVSLFVRSNVVLLVNPSVPATTARELIEYVKQNPGKVLAASPSVASMGGFLTMKLAEWGKIDLPLVPYKGSAPAMQAVMANEVQVFMADITQSLPFIQSGKLRVIAQLGETRAPQLPQVETLSETIPGFTSDLWFGFVTKAGTPPSTISTLNQQINGVLGSSEMREKALAMGASIVRQSPEHFQTLLNEEAKTYGDLIERNKISIN